ncbi:MAG TPA: Mur ligase family protein, partial [Agriterribacter sp.]|nr:Mur ligase family protein [Agriterribacter sp.]
MMAKKMVILGGGESGTGAAILCRKQGTEVFVSDSGRIPDRYKNELKQYDIAWEEEKHSEDKILNADEIVKSPGIPEQNRLVQKIKAKGIQLISEIELAYRHKEKSKIIAVTGSNGKSTTTALTGHICKTGGIDCAVVGNIGYSFARQVALDPKPLYVVEVSSFQLDDIETFNADIAVLLNITEDHLDRYAYRFENYIRSKFNIIKNQTPADYFIYCADDPVITQHLETYPLLSNPLPFTMQYELPKG